MRERLELLKAYSIKNNRKRILKNYYSKEMRKGKTYRASFVDKFLFVFSSFILLSMALIMKSQNILLSLYLSGMIIFFVFNAINEASKKKKKSKIIEINNNLKKKKLIREFSNLNKEGFTNYIKVLLEEYYDGEITTGEYPMDLIISTSDGIYGVKCLKISMEDKVTLRDLENFQRELKNIDIEDGILITNSYIRDDVKEEASIILYDFDNIVEILDELGRYSTDQDMEDYIVDSFMNKRNNIKNEVMAMDKKKIIQLYGSFLVFYFLSFVIAYPRFYKLMAILCFLIASIGSGYKISEYIRLKDEYPLQ